MPEHVARFLINGVETNLVHSITYDINGPKKSLFGAPEKPQTILGYIVIDPFLLDFFPIESLYNFVIEIVVRAEDVEIYSIVLEGCSYINEQILLYCDLSPVQIFRFSATNALVESLK